jgi:cell division protease FtsH
VFGDITNGAAQDLKNITRIARQMVCQWGMSDTLGPVTFKSGEEHPFLGRELAQQKDFSEHTARIIDEEIQGIIHRMEKKARDTLSENRDMLDTLATALMEKETMVKEDIDALLNGEK